MNFFCSPLSLDRRPLQALCLIFCLTLLMSCQSSHRDQSKTETITDPREQMEALSSILIELIPYYRNQDAPLNSLDTHRLKTKMTQLRTIANHVDRGVGKVGGPLYESSSKYLVQEAEFALSALDKGETEMALMISKKVVGACITCHTQSTSLSRNFKTEWYAPALKLEKLDLGNFYLATRQYDKAMDTYNEALTDARLRSTDFERWYEGTVRSVAVAVRVKDSPSLALEMVSSLFDADSVPEKVHHSARHWQQSLKQWRTEIRSGSDYANNSSSRVLTLVDQNLTTMEKGNQGEARHLIERLRISNTLNKIFVKPTLTKEELARAYLHAGRNSAALENVDMTSPALFYFQACIRTAPGSKVAKECFHRFESKFRSDFLTEKPPVKRKIASVQTEFPAFLNELEELRNLAHQN